MKFPSFLDPLDVRKVSPGPCGHGIWLILAPFSFYSAALDQVITFYPDNPGAGRTTDFCSVPSVPLIFDLYGDKYHQSGAAHDDMYRRSMFPRDVCDRLLSEMVLSEGANRVEARAFYCGVSEFGGSHYGTE